MKIPNFAFVLPSLAFSLSTVLAISFSLSACSTSGTQTEIVPIDSSLSKQPSATQALTRISFGSCNKQYLPQPLWKKIASEDPSLFIWTGDVVYADTRDMGHLSRIYASELNQPEYRSFLASGTPVIGVWDDHDYGENDAGKDYPPKKMSQQLFLDFIGEPKDSARRAQEGIYTSYVFGEGAEALRIILLDTRSNRSKDDMLGSEQWQWLEKELASDRGAATLIVSSIQVLPQEQAFEKWENVPSSRARLLKLMETSPTPNFVILSGDRHFAELSRTNAGSKEIWEITASGLTHSFRNPDDKRNHNSLRVGPILDRLNYGLIDFDAAKKSLRIQVKDLNRTAVIDQTVLLK